MLTASQRANARARMAPLMNARCAVTGSGEPVWNPDTLQNDDADGAATYTGVCRIRPVGSQDQTSEAGNQTFTESRYIFSVPIDGSEQIKAGDVVKITASEDDPALVGKSFAVGAMAAYSQGTLRRIPVTEVQ